MKPRIHALLIGVLLLGPACFGQSSEVPSRISYQGMITDASGGLIGDAAPVNRAVIFRIWDHPSDFAEPNLIYSEQQTATVSKGQFSVLIGAGAAVSGSPLGFNEATKGPGPGFSVADAFAGSGRYLGVTIDADNSGGAEDDVEISPRQQIVTSAFSFRAREAESAQSFGLGDGSIVYDEGTQTMTLSTAGTTRLTIDANGRTSLGEPGAAQGFFVNQPSYYQESLSFADPDDGQFDRVGMYFDTSNDSLRFADTYRDIDLMALTDTGNLGIGTVSPESTLHVSNGNSGVATNYPNSEAEPVLLLENDSNTTIQFKAADANLSGLVFGNSVSPRHGTIYYDNDATGDNGQMLFRTGNIAAYPMVIGANGNVGMGTQAPETFLHIRDGDAAGVGLAYPTSTKMVIESSAGAYMQFQTPNGTASGLVFGSGDNDAEGAIFYANGNNGDNKALYFRTGGSTVDRMVISENGKVGIGTGTPVASLDTRGAAWIAGDNAGGFPASAGGGIRLFRHSSGYGSIFGYNYSTGQAEPLALQSAGGNVGIGTTNPDKAKLEISGSVTYDLGAHYLYTSNYSSTPYNTPPPGTRGVSIYASNGIASPQFAILSDARIKRVRGVSDAAADLATISQIQISDYNYVDPVAYGAQPEKKVIAQQVEEVFPQAVLRSTNVVPDIFEVAPHRGGWIQLETDLKAGERVRLVADNYDETIEVEEVGEGRFRTSAAIPGDRVLVYGREVDDFRTVDYDAIAMLNVSATQELHRRVVAQEGEIESLKERIAELEARDAARDERVATIEALLRGSSPGGTATVPVARRTAD
ncbi:cell wall surface anchor family protein [Haloferula helveola]|uniref:Cell wall surface anchor family protein n=1 Tax=Haloferula helveola TaxID=490095 RepID=A0ABM7REQ0_9BACT|nr:cell wall surface anchor family protein [Haloferula helveola]